MIPCLTRSEAVLSGGFRFRDPSLLCARARLYTDRLELSGWRLHGRYFRRIPLEQILHVDVPNADALLLWLSDGEKVSLEVEEALRWKGAIDQYDAKLRNHSI